MMYRMTFRIIISIVIAGFFIGSSFYYLLGSSYEHNEFQFGISQGASLRDISRSLEEQDYIRSAAAFKLYSILSGSAHRLKPGTYTFFGDMRVPDIIRAFVKGPQEVTVLITEGKALQGIDSLLSNQGFLPTGVLATFSGKDFDYLFLQNISSLEGFLFPDTYRFLPSASGEEIVNKFLENFSIKAWPLLEEYARKETKLDWYDILIIASLIEKEVPETEDRRIVSGILRKRLSLGLPLQIDATVIYATCGGFDKCPPLTKSDFAIKSDFNTYQVFGLPPAPIANPGVDAIYTALNPVSSPYLYYLSDPKTQKTIFSKTFEEHNINRSRYLSR